MAWGTRWRAVPLLSQGEKSKAGAGHKRVHLVPSLDTETRGMLRSKGRGERGGVLSGEILAGKRRWLRRRWEGQGKDRRSGGLSGHYNVAATQLEVLWSSLPPDLEL